MNMSEEDEKKGPFGDLETAIKALSSLSDQVLDSFVMALSKGFDSGEVAIKATENGLATMYKRTFISAVSIDSLSNDEKNKTFSHLVHLAFHMVNFDPTQTTLAKETGVSESYEKNLQKVFELLQREHILEVVSYRGSCIMPTMDISSLETVKKWVKLAKPVESIYPCAEIYFTVNQNGHETPLTIQLNKNELAVLVKELGDVLQDLKQEPQIQKG